MPLVTHAHRVSQQGAGKFSGRADQRKYVTTWAVVEGANRNPGFPHLRDALEGIPFGEKGEAVQWKEFKDGSGNPHEIHHDGLKLREVYAERDVLQYKDKAEGALSMARINNFLDEEQTKSLMRGGDVSRSEIEPRVVETIEDDPDAPPPTAPRGRGWPKGKPRKPRAETQPQTETPT